MPVRCARGPGLTFTLARVLVRAPIDGPGLQPTDVKDHTKCVVRALVPTLGRVPAACVSSPRDGAVSMGSHMQQDMVISVATQRLGATLPLFDPVHLRKPRCKKFPTGSPETQLSFVSVTTRVFGPAGRILQSGVTKNNSQNKFHVIAVVLSTTVMSAATLWPLRKRIHS